MVQLDNAVDRYKQIILTELKEAGINCWIAGGALRDYFMAVKITTDYDLFFPNELEYEKAKTFFKAKEAEIKWESENGMKVKYGKRTYDLVKKYFENPQATIDNFDFTVSMFAVDTEKVYFGETTFIDLAKRQLMLNKIPYPASTMKRAFRYYNKGFKMCAGEMMKLVIAIQNMPKQEENQNNTVGTENNEPPSGDEVGNFFFGID
jgi:hypothetical protein